MGEHWKGSGITQEKMQGAGGGGKGIGGDKREIEGDSGGHKKNISSTHRSYESMLDLRT